MKAKTELGSKFDIENFHGAVLLSGLAVRFARRITQMSQQCAHKIERNTTMILARSRHRVNFAVNKFIFNGRRFLRRSDIL